MHLLLLLPVLLVIPPQTSAAELLPPSSFSPPPPACSCGGYGRYICLAITYVLAVFIPFLLERERNMVANWHPKHVTLYTSLRVSATASLASWAAWELFAWVKATVNGDIPPPPHPSTTTEAVRYDEGMGFRKRRDIGEDEYPDFSYNIGTENFEDFDYSPAHLPDNIGSSWVERGCWMIVIITTSILLATAAIDVGRRVAPCIWRRLRGLARLMRHRRCTMRETLARQWARLALRRATPAMSADFHLDQEGIFLHSDPRDQRHCPMPRGGQGSMELEMTSRLDHELNNYKATTGDEVSEGQEEWENPSGLLQQTSVQEFYNLQSDGDQAEPMVDSVCG